MKKPPSEPVPTSSVPLEPSSEDALKSEAVVSTILTLQTPHLTAPAPAPAGVSIDVRTDILAFVPGFTHKGTSSRRECPVCKKNFKNNKAATSHMSTAADAEHVAYRAGVDKVPERLPVPVSADVVERTSKRQRFERLG